MKEDRSSYERFATLFSKRETHWILRGVYCYVPWPRSFSGSKITSQCCRSSARHLLSVPLVDSKFSLFERLNQTEIASDCSILNISGSSHNDRLLEKHGQGWGRIVCCYKISLAVRDWSSRMPASDITESTTFILKPFVNGCRWSLWRRIQTKQDDLFTILRS